MWKTPRQRLLCCSSTSRITIESVHEWKLNWREILYFFICFSNEKPGRNGRFSNLRCNQDPPALLSVESIRVYISVYSIRYVTLGSRGCRLRWVHNFQLRSIVRQYRFNSSSIPISFRPDPTRLDRENRTTNLADPNLVSCLRRLLRDALRTMFYTVYQGSPTVFLVGQTWDTRWHRGPNLFRGKKR